MWSTNALLFTLVVWVVVLLYLSHNHYTIQTKSDASGVFSQLDKALSNIQELEKQNVQLKELIESDRKYLRELETQRKKEKKNQEEREMQKKVVASPVNLTSNFESGLPFEHEQSRRGVDQRIWELMYLLKNQFNRNVNNGTAFEKHAIDQLYSLLASSQKLGDVSQEWRRKSLTELTAKIQEKINKLQNPKDCAKAKILICELDKPCGFGCQLHHVGYCFMAAFGEQRALILHDGGKPWRYSTKGWRGAFLPVSGCSFREAVGSDTPVQYEKDSPSRVVELPFHFWPEMPIHRPLAFPTQLKEEMIKLHPNPPVYFIGQFLWYLMRSNKMLRKTLNQGAAKIPFGKNLIVGIQVRRTDKLVSEAVYHSVDEYMDWAEVWFRVQDIRLGKKVPRKVYIASDDPTVVPEARKKYPHYAVFGDVDIADSAQLNNRYTDASLIGVVTDIRLLSQCDYLVCTLSSSVCRIGWALMQARVGDAGDAVHSLDDVYWYAGQYDHEQTVLEAHQAERAEEIDLSIGDTVAVDGNHWDGYSKGTNRRTGKKGLYPSYKVEEKWHTVDFPIFDN